MAKKTKPYDPSKYLDSAEGIAAYISEALATRDLQVITHAIGVAAKARGMTQIAEETGLSRESLYRALSEEGNPEFDTIARVLKALGLNLQVEAADQSETPEAPKAKKYA